jgi:methylated-DNA-[protein]-cysteine S-methyltransferase
MPQRTLDSPIGPILITSENGLLTGLRINAATQPDVPGDESALDMAARQLGEYFAGERTDFDLPLAPSKSVRGEALRAAIAGIRHGETARYGDLADVSGSGARAIGQACARNPLPIIIPCHRVLGSAGIGHYSGGDGVRTKQWLLAHEAGDLWAK